MPERHTDEVDTDKKPRTSISCPYVRMDKESRPSRPSTTTEMVSMYIGDLIRRLKS